MQFNEFKKKLLEKEFVDDTFFKIDERFFEIENSFNGREIGSETFMEIAIKLGEQVLETTGLRWKIFV